MKMCCISDLHGHLPDVPECDLLLIAGDIVPLDRQRDLRASAEWLDIVLRRWLCDLECRVVAVAGNHDLVFERDPDLVPDLPWTYLQDSGTEHEGLKIWGSPWQEWFGGWAFNLHEHELEEKWSLIPEDTNILLLHGPPYGYGDVALWEGNHVGSPSLLERIRDVRPMLAVYGHIHNGHGTYRLHEDDRETILVNASHVDDSYRVTNGPVVVEIPTPACVPGGCAAGAGGGSSW